MAYKKSYPITYPPRGSRGESWLDEWRGRRPLWLTPLKRPLTETVSRYEVRSLGGCRLLIYYAPMYPGWENKVKFCRHLRQGRGRTWSVDRLWVTVVVTLTWTRTGRWLGLKEFRDVLHMLRDGDSDKVPLGQILFRVGQTPVYSIFNVSSPFYMTGIHKECGRWVTDPYYSSLPIGREPYEESSSECEPFLSEQGKGYPFLSIVFFYSIVLFPFQRWIFIKY